MTKVPSALQSLTVSADRIAAAPKRHVSPETATPSASAFQRERPFDSSSEFVEIDGKRYYLNAPRGTYLNILV